jgi:hypothetical protein
MRSAASRRATGLVRRALSTQSGSSSSSVSATDRYLFDLNGFLVIKKVFNASEVDAANLAVNAHLHEQHERWGKLKVANAYGVRGNTLTGTKGRFDLAGMLGWAEGERELFRRVMTHERLVPYYHAFLGAGYRLDHLPFLIRMERGSEGHAFHGGAVQPNGSPAWPLSYHCSQGEIRCSLLAVALQLSDTRAGDGGFCIVPGSHKAAFACPERILAYEEACETVVQPVLSKGDVVLFTEAATHGTLPWVSDVERRTVIYRFSPAGSAYGRSYLEGGLQGMAADLDGLTDAEAAVMQPPFHPRLDRAKLAEDGTLEPTKSREDYKKEFDKKVFGKNYF